MLRFTNRHVYITLLQIIGLVLVIGITLAMADPRYGGPTLWWTHAMAEFRYGRVYCSVADENV